MWSGAQSGAPYDESPPLSPDLQLLMTAWNDLPESIRQTIMALVQHVSGNSQEVDNG